jgi:acyl dehydratase
LTEGSLISEKITSMLGQVSPPAVLKVEAGAITRYADAIDDPNPLYRDVEYARNSRYGEIICPPGFFGWPIKGGGLEAGELMGKVLGAVFESGMMRILDGGVDYDFYLPVRAGDTLVVYGKFADARERVGQSGKMLFLTMEQTYLNQNGDMVAKQRSTLICS